MRRIGPILLAGLLAFTAGCAAGDLVQQRKAKQNAKWNRDYSWVNWPN